MARRDYTYGSMGDCTITFDNLSPEGRIPAPTGSMHLDLDSATIYLKQSGVEATGWVAVAGGGGGSLPDGDYGDVTISGGGTLITINDEAVTLDKLQDIPSGYVLGRTSPGTGDVELIPISSLVGDTGSGAEVLSVAAQAISIGTWTLMAFDTEVRDDGGYWSSGAPGRFTISEAGWYSATFWAVFGATVSASIAAITKNGDPSSGFEVAGGPYANGPGNMRCQAAFVGYLVPGDYLEAWVYSTTAPAGVDASPNARFGIVKIGGGGGGGGGSPAGADTQVQFNDGGAFGADAGFTYSAADQAIGINGGYGPAGYPGIFSANWMFLGSSGNASMAVRSDTLNLGAGIPITWSPSVPAFSADLGIGRGGPGNLQVGFGGVPHKVTIVGETVTADSPVLDMTQTWDNAAVAFNAIKLRVGTTAGPDFSFASGSRLLSLGGAAVGEVFGVGVYRQGGTDYPRAAIYVPQYSAFIIGSLSFGNDANPYAITVEPPHIRLGSAGYFGWTPYANDANSAADAAFLRQGIGTVALATPNNWSQPTTFRAYNYGADSVNYERGKLEWLSNVFNIGTEKGGTGTARALTLQTDGTTRMTVGATTGIVDFTNTPTVLGVPIGGGTRRIAQNQTQVTVDTGTTEQTLDTFTVPASTLAVDGDAIIYEFYGFAHNSSGASKTVRHRLRVDGSAWGDVTYTLAATQSYGVRIRLKLFRVNSGLGRGSFELSLVSNATPAAPLVLQNTLGAAFTWTSTFTVAVSAQLGAATGESATKETGALIFERGA